MKLKAWDTRTKANTGVEKELLDLRTGKGSGAFITILGTDSDKWHSIKAERSRAMADRMVDSQRKELSQEEIDETVVQSLADMTVGWRGLEDDAGNEIVFIRDAAVKLYRDYPAIRDQVNAWIGERRNFLAT